VRRCLCVKLKTREESYDPVCYGLLHALDVGRCKENKVYVEGSDEAK
jgi:hypothetical protein